MEVSVQLHASAALPLGKESSVPVNLKTLCTPDMVWTLWRIGKSLAHTSNQTPQFLSFPVYSLVDIPIEISLKHVMKEKFLLLLGTEY
jgi:hypothetical protein